MSVQQSHRQPFLQLLVRRVRVTRYKPPFCRWEQTLQRSLSRTRTRRQGFSFTHVAAGHKSNQQSDGQNPGKTKPVYRGVTVAQMIRPAGTSSLAQPDPTPSSFYSIPDNFQIQTLTRGCVQRRSELMWRHRQTDVADLYYKHVTTNEKAGCRQLGRLGSKLLLQNCF